MGALDFDSAGFFTSGFELGAFVSDCCDFESDDLLSLGFDSLGFDSFAELDSLPSALSDAVEDDAPSPFDAAFREELWSFFPSLP